MTCVPPPVFSKLQRTSQLKRRVLIILWKVETFDGKVAFNPAGVDKFLISHNYGSTVRLHALLESDLSTRFSRSACDSAEISNDTHPF